MLPPPRPALPVAALTQVLQTGRACAPQLLDQGIDPDAAWRKNEPVAIKVAPLLFDFKWLPKPEFVPPKLPADAASTGLPDAAAAPLACAPAASDGAVSAPDGSSLAGRKRKAAEMPGLGTAGTTNGVA